MSSISAFTSDYQSALNKSVYSDLQSQIDRQRQLSAITKTPQKRKILSFQKDEVTDNERFTDILKIKPKAKLAPIELKSKINIDIPGTIPVKSGEHVLSPKLREPSEKKGINLASSEEVQRSNNHTTAFLYSKIGAKKKFKRSSIMQNIPEELPPEERKSNYSLQHKSTASSLIATLGKFEVVS